MAMRDHWRILLGHLATGTAAGLAFAAGILATNMFGLQDLIMADRAPLLAGGLFVAGCISLFASAAVTTGMLIGRDDQS